MNTSYFAKYKGNNGVSIARYTPSWFGGARYIRLAPPPELINWWKRNQFRVNKELELAYLGWYHSKVLHRLDPEKVYEELGSDAVLLCYEKKGEFCHRKIVADWIYYHLKIKVLEL